MQPTPRCVLHRLIRSADEIPGMDREWHADLGQAGGRDPDALPPRNAFERIMKMLHTEVGALGRGNALFALKAALLTS